MTTETWKTTNFDQKKLISAFGSGGLQKGSATPTEISFSVPISTWFSFHNCITISNNVVVRAKWTMDIGLDSSVVEHLNSDAGVPGSIPGPAIYIFFVFLCICSFLHPYYIWCSDLPCSGICN